MFYDHFKFQLCFGGIAYLIPFGENYHNDWNYLFSAFNPKVQYKCRIHFSKTSTRVAPQLDNRPLTTDNWIVFPDLPETLAQWGLLLYARSIFNSIESENDLNSFDSREGRVTNTQISLGLGLLPPEFSCKVWFFQENYIYISEQKLIITQLHHPQSTELFFVTFAVA